MSVTTPDYCQLKPVGDAEYVKAKRVAENLDSTVLRLDYEFIATAVASGIAKDISQFRMANCTAPLVVARSLHKNISHCIRHIVRVSCSNLTY